MTLYVGSNKIKGVSTHGVYIGSQNTNCLTYVPKNINLTLSNGVLTLKAGSKVYVPNGKNADGSLKFDEVVVKSDAGTKLSSSTTSTSYIVIYSETRAWATGKGIDYFLSNIYSGTTQPTVSGNNNLWYDTANNKMMTTSNAGANWVESRTSLPFCIATGAKSNVTSIDQIFDWCGYIGSTVFVLPGVEGLIPNGFNADETYKVIEANIPTVKTVQTISDWYSKTVNMRIYETDFALGSVTYVKTENYNKAGENIRYCAAVGNVTIDSVGKITSLTPATVQPPTTTIPIKQIVTTPKTNGITYIPQDIKFEIVDGTTPTLYAGSEVWVPYGRAAPELSIGDSLNSGIITAISWDNSALFYKVRYDTDLSVDITSDPANGDFVTSISPTHSFWWFYPNYSQDTAPSDFGQYALWYDTAENIVKITIDSGSTWDNYGSLPIGVFTMAGTGATKKLKYAFNGFGYIGTTCFVVPGVKGLMADGLNEDGSYKTIERTFDRFVMRRMAFNRDTFYGVVLDGEYTIQGEKYMEAAELPAAPDGYAFCYRKSDNTLWWTLNNNTWVQYHGLPIGFWTTSTGGISNFNPAKNFIKVYQYNSYEPGTVLCNLSNGASSSVEFRKGVYYIRAQGGGGSGGTYGDYGWGRGSGGGSGAGFEGYILVKRNIICNVSTGAAVSSGKWSVNGNSTQIENMFIFGGGEGGKTNEDLAVGGELTVIANDDYEILTAKYLGNGNGTKVVDGNKRYGGDSVLSNDGGGLPSANATSFGAGGGGFTGSGINGGAGGAGECLIQYISYEPEGKTTHLEYFKTPTLTGSITSVAEGNIVVTSSYNNTSSWNNTCNNSYIMRNTISTTTDSGYWQMNGSNTQWLQIKFPYTLVIKGMTIASRPNDNYTGTVTAYTNADKTVKMGSVTTNAGATNFTLANMENGAFVTDTIYLYITNMDTWYGLQNLQIRGYKVLDNSISLSVFF